MNLYSAQYWLVLGQMQEFSERSCPLDSAPLAVNVAVRMALVSSGTSRTPPPLRTTRSPTGIALAYCFLKSARIRGR
ncbi:MAG: hypothetical protein RL328_622 [Acidobacteriota bacterium]|jgi:hypothetical protein